MSPEQAPPGIECHFVNIWRERPFIHPRLLLIHTNGASVESNLQSQLNWSNAAHDNTKPHYVVDRRGRAWKTLPSNRKGIANYLADAFGLSIETTDLGWPNPGGAVGFSEAQAETVARIVAWESELWDFPIVTPTAWDGTGVAAHTDPFTYPQWTKYQGKACPGTQKKIEVRSVILPRARQLRDGDEMPALRRPERPYDSRDPVAPNPMRKDETRVIRSGYDQAVSAQVHITVVNAAGPGFLTFWDGSDPRPEIATINFNPSHGLDDVGATVPLTAGDFTVYASVGCDLVIDLQQVV